MIAMVILPRDLFAQHWRSSFADVRALAADPLTGARLVEIRRGYVMRSRPVEIKDNNGVVCEVVPSMTADEVAVRHADHTDGCLLYQDGGL